ncbi:aldo/keto reductase [Actinotalea sp. K2]|uniref:aldo/keto reductase n=1 Tax=Actinotalea sp. K2 TaxID=2939438 RepID=UPI00201769F3|nr:aldo/keto reductase [Actinotalea sp. K2]MCL3859470.1 aldo/keto reductase [Actinotalea sp. K2]
MRYLDLPDTPRISRLGLGTWQFGSREWGYGGEYADSRAAQIVHRALDLGVTTIDTAEAYGMGRSERILGKALVGRRDEAYVATKYLPLLPVQGLVERQGRASRDRLGIDRIDLYQVHQANPVTPDTVLMTGMEALQDAGVIRDVGVSNYDLRRWRVAEAALGRRVLSNQVRYSLVDRQPETDLLPYAQQNDRVIIAYSPLAMGFLSTRYDESNRPSGPVRKANPLFLPDNLRAARPLFATLRDVASRHDAQPAQVALAWLLHQPNVVVIPGASSVEQLERNVEAAELDLTLDEVVELRAAAEAFHPVTGAAAVPEVLRNLRG